MKKISTKHLATYAIIVGIAFIVTLVRIPIFSAAPFLKLDFKDVIISLGALMFGPLPGAAMAILVALIEMVTISESFLYGFFMNALSSIVFACISSYVARKFEGKRGILSGFIFATLCVTAVMVLWNYIITPWYQGWPRERIVPMLIPVFLPFNLIKYSANSVLAMMLLQPVTSALKRGGLLKGA